MVGQVNDFGEVRSELFSVLLRPGSAVELLRSNFAEQVALHESELTSKFHGINITNCEGSIWRTTLPAWYNGSEHRKNVS